MLNSHNLRAYYNSCGAQLQQVRAVLMTKRTEIAQLVRLRVLIRMQISRTMPQ